jgi:hypothetical protein
VTNGWTRDVLLNQIKNQLHRRLGPAPSGQVSERRLEDALVHRLERVHAQARPWVLIRRPPGALRCRRGRMFLVDLLLFFHIPSLRYVVLELTIEKFMPEHLGRVDSSVAGSPGGLTRGTRARWLFPAMPRVSFATAKAAPVSVASR